MAKVVKLERPKQRSLTEDEQELTLDEQERFEGLCQCIADSEDADENENDSQVWCQVAVVNGQRRVVVWVATGEPDNDSGDQPCEPLAVLLSEADVIVAEGVEHVGPEPEPARPNPSPSPSVH